MTKPFTLLTAAVLCILQTSAQVPVTDPSSESLQSCLLGTRPSIWATLELTRDQLQRVEYVQEACKEECAVAGAKKQANAISNADGNTIIGELKSILTPEQYHAWVAYCAGSTTNGQAPK